MFLPRLHWRAIALLSAVLVGAPGAVSASERRAIIGIDLPSLFGNGDGSYARLHQRVMELAGLDFPLRMLPPARALAVFQGGGAECIFPTSRLAMGTTTPFVSSTPVNYIRVHIATRDGEPVLTPRDLQGRRVGAVLGIGSIYGDIIRDPAVTVEFARDEATNLRKLAAGRLDAALVVIPDALTAASQLGLRFAYDPLAAVRIYDDSYVCLDTPEGVELARQLSRAIWKLSNSGELKAILNAPRRETEVRMNKPDERPGLNDLSMPGG